MNKKQLLFRVALALSSIMVTLCIYATQIIYFSQREYFTNYFIELVSIPLLYVGVMTFILWLVLAILPRAILKYISAALLVTALLFWLQVDVFSVSYGVLDGSNINFDKFNQRGIWELVVLVGALLLSLLLNKIINKHFAMVIGLIMLGQLILTGVNVFNEPVDKSTIAELDDEFFNYSTDKNIIIIILDTFGGEIFQDLMLKYPDFKQQYSGFVSYTDAISNYPATKGSLPSMLTGQMIPKNIKTADYIKNVVGEKGMPAFFADKGYESSVISSYSWFRGFYPKRFMSEPPLHPEDLKRFNAAMLFDYALFRLAPHILKEQVYGQGNWFTSNQVSTHTEVPGTDAEQANLFLEIMTNKAVVADSTPRFKLIHVKTPHPPFVYDMDCQKDTLQENASSHYYMEQQSVCALRKLNALLEKYKELGVYDDSLIVVTSDHGSRLFDDMSYTGFPSYFEMNSSGIMFMIKGMGQTDEFNQVIRSFSLIKLFNALTDTSLHQSKYNSLIDLQRLFYAYKNNFVGALRMMPDAPLYAVGANYKNPKSWQLQEFVVNQCDAKKMPVNMTFETNLREQYCGIFGFGLAEPSSAGSWTESIDARVLFNLDDSEIKSNDFYVIEITFEPKAFDQQKEFKMTVQLNEKVIGSSMIKEPGIQTITFNIPAEIFKPSGLQELRFLMPDLKSDYQLGVGYKTKVLGVLMKSIVISISSP